MKIFEVFFKIPYEISDEDGRLCAGNIFLLSIVQCYGKSEAKMKAIQNVRNNSRGLHWIKDLNKSPFGCIQRVEERNLEFNYERKHKSKSPFV